VANKTLGFTFSDTIAGYVDAFDSGSDTFTLKTSDGRAFEVRFAANTYGELVRNLDEPYQDCTGQMRAMVTPGRHLFAYGIYYPEGGGNTFEAMHIIFLGRTQDEYRFEAQDWWIKQIKSLGNFYLKAQFPDGVVD